MTATRARYCICGRSSSFPLCDGTHRDEGWRCGVTRTPTPLAFCATYRLENLAFKLASAHQGILLTLENVSSLRLQRLILLVEGTSWEELQALFGQADAAVVELLTLDTPPSLLQQDFPGARIHALPSPEPFHAFAAADAFVTDPGSLQRSMSEHTLPSVFLSHAVADEPFLLPLVRKLRERFSLSLFVCADSIPGGQRWQEEIEAALRERDCFVGILSEDALRSHFCSFELGVAMALRKPIYLLSLDGSMPHAFAQHLQTVDLRRLQKSQPWRELEELFQHHLLLSVANPTNMGP